MTNDKKKPRGLSDSHLHQINVLKALSTGNLKADVKAYDIHEIAEISGLRDEKETQRYLFILEGQKLVSPSPQGDFTSRVWQITAQGIRAVKTISATPLQ